LPSWSDATASGSSTFSSVHVSVTSPQHIYQTARAAVCLSLVSTARLLQDAQEGKLTASAATTAAAAAAAATAAAVTVAAYLSS